MHECIYQRMTKGPFGSPGLVDFLVGQVTCNTHLSNGNGSCKSSPNKIIVEEEPPEEAPEKQNV